MSNAKNSQSAKQSNRADGEKAKLDVKQTVTDSIIALIEAGGLEDLRERWTGGNKGLPVNAKTGVGYTGVNVFLLMMAGVQGGYSSNRWLTYKQAQELGGNVRKGESSTLGVFFKKYERDSKENPEEKEQVSFATALRLFNVEQVDGLPAEVLKEEPRPDAAQILADCEALLMGSGAAIHYQGNRAFYSPSKDAIYLPERDRFHSTEMLYSTAFHELAHWTGAKSRLDRNLNNRFGDEAYAMEELIAELAAAFVCAQTSVKNACLQDNAAYLANWLQVLKNDKSAIFTAASAAWKAASFILDFSKVEAPQFEALAA